MGLRCLHTSIFIETPSPGGLPLKAKKGLSPHEMRLSPAGHQPSISWSRVFIIIIIIIVVIISSTIIIAALLQKVRFSFIDIFSLGNAWTKTSNKC